MGERRSSPKVNNVSGRGARREAASLRRDRRPAHVKKTQLGPEYVASALGEAARREAASLLGTADHRMSKVRPRCQRQPRRGHEEPVEATDALRPTGGGRSAESGPSQLPGGGSDPLRPPDQCPASEAINSSRQTCPASEAINSDSPDGCPAGEGLITPTAGLDRGRRAKSTPSFRSALPAKDQRQLRFGSIPSWETGGERIILRSCPCNRDHAPRVSMVENLGKSQTVLSLSRPQAPQKRACGAPFEDCRQIVH